MALGGRLNWLVAFSLLLLGSQFSLADVIPPNVDLPEAEKSSAGKRFSEVPSGDSGIDFVNSWKAPRDYERALTLSFGAGGVAVGDYDGDGRPDLYLSRPFGGGQLYRNLGDLSSKTSRKSAGLAGRSFGRLRPVLQTLMVMVIWISMSVPLMRRIGSISMKREFLKSVRKRRA